MGRSVNYLNNALRVAYVSYEDTYEDEDGEVVVDDMAFDDLYENITYDLMGVFPSLKVVRNEWDNRETRIFLRNRLVEFGISEYCGIVSVSVQVYDEELSGLASSWVDKNWDRIEGLIGANLRKVGSFSNGEVVYQKI
jgi:hypothetical protein